MRDAFVNLGDSNPFSYGFQGGLSLLDLMQQTESQAIAKMNAFMDWARATGSAGFPKAQQQMTTSAAGVAFIKGWEAWNGTVDKKTGLTYAKDDGFGNGTIGWGHKCAACADFTGGITKAQGDALLTKDLGSFEGAVNGLGANLSQQQFDGLVAFAFNVRNFGGSTLFSNVASGSPVTEGNFTAYGNAHKNGVLVHVPSIYRRRESEWNVYANGVYDSSH
jgi:GH24 family phage-related lysozyme (muramidase)